MQIFENNSFNTFLHNNNSHVKNYVVIPVGTTNIAVYNAYDTKLQLLPSTHYTQVSVDGSVYGSQAELMSYLSPLLFYKASGSTEGGGSISGQNNKARIAEYPILVGEGSITTNEVATFLNNQPAPFVVSEIQTPVIFTFNRIENGITKKYIFLFTQGKGAWGGVGGSAPVYGSYFRLLSVLTLTGEDVENGDNNQIYDLGVIPDGDFVTVANASDDEFDFSDSTQSYYFTYTQDDILYFYLFIGENAVYAGESGNSFVNEDFVGITNSNVQPIPNLQQITDIGNITDNSIVFIGDNDQISRDNYGEEYTDANGNKVRVNYPATGLTENISYSVPAKDVNDTFAMLGDINGMTITANQAASEIYLNNAEGTTIATLSVAFLNNEGTTFFYNESTEMLELKDDEGNVLSSVPVSAFVSNLMQSVNFNGSTPYVLEFKDSTGNVVDSVSFAIENIQGLQSALDGKFNNPAGTTSQYIRGNGTIGTFANDVRNTNLTSLSTATSTPITASDNVLDAFGKVQGQLNNSLLIRQIIPASTDLNSYVETGIYNQTLNSNAASGSNYPVALAGSLEVIRVSSTLICQRYHVVGGGVSTDNQVYIRIYASSVWGAWKRLITSLDTSVSNWDTVYNDRVNYLRNQADGSAGSILNSSSHTDVNNLITGMAWMVGSTTNLPNTSSHHILSLGGSSTYASQLALRGSNFFFRSKESSVWQPWKRLWHDGDFTSTNISNWNTAYGWGDFRTFGLGAYVNLGNVGTNGLNDKAINTGFYFASGVDTGIVGGNNVKLISIGNSSLSTTQAQIAISHGGSNALAFRSSTGNTWSQVWHTGNFTQTNVNNWNTAYGWGDYHQYGLGTTGTTNVSDLSNQSLAAGLYTTATISLNSPLTGSSGSLLNLRSGVSGGAVGQLWMKSNNASGEDVYVRHSDNTSTFYPWRRLWHDGDFSGITNTTISNWNTAYNRGDFKDYGHGTGVQNNALISSDVLEFNTTGVYRVASSTTNLPVAENGYIQRIYRSASTRYILFYSDSGRVYKNVMNSSTWSGWEYLWDSSDFTQTNINNWNTAYGWGNHSGLYVPAGVFSGSTSDYISGDGTIFNFRNSVKSTPLTDFSPEVNSVGEGDSVQLAIEKLSGTQGQKANLASPALVGTPTAPTASNGTNTTQIATTAFVQNAIGSGLISQGGNSFGSDVVIGTNDAYDIVVERNNVEMARFGYNNLKLRNNSQITTTTAGKSIYLSDGNFLYTNTVTGTTAAHRFVGAGTSTGSIMQFVDGSTVKATVERDGQVVGSPAVYDNAFVTLGQLVENIILTASTALVSTAINIHVTNDSGDECTCILPAANVSAGKTIHLYNIATDLLIIESESTADIFTPVGTMADFSMSFGQYYKLYSNGIFWMRTQG